MNLTLTAAEESIASPILQPLLHSIILTNDYFSWEKESSEENPRLMSAVALFMKWQSCSATEAKEVVKTKIIDLEEEYLARKTAYLQKTGSGDTLPSVCRVFDLVEAIAAGLFLFDMTCPRYHCPGDNVYQSYFESRAKDGYLFFDSCTDSEDLLRCGSLNGIVNGTKRMEIDNSTRKNEAVNGASQMPSAFINLAIYIGKCYDDFPLSAAFLIFSCLDELNSMYRGQAHDLYWTSNGLCPTEEEYLSMIDASEFDCAHHISLMANMTCFSLETSALFRLASRLSRAEATSNK